MSSVLAFLSLALAYGTAAAVLAWVLERLLREKVSPALMGVLWSLALAKFFVPFGPALPVSVGPVQPAEAFVSAVAVAGNAAALSPGSLWPALLCASYLLAVTVLAARRLAAARRLVRSIRALPVASHALTASVRAAASQLRLRSVPLVRRGGGPFVAGWWRPTLVLPFDRCDSAEARAMVLHELAHLRRGDLWVRALQDLAQVLFFFWPPVAWVNRKLDHYRELACDQVALEHGALSPAAYARVLVETSRHAARRSSLLAVLEMSSRSSPLEKRVEMVLNLDRPRSRKWTALAVACGVGLGLTGRALALGAAIDGAPDEAVMKKLLQDNRAQLRACYDAAFAGIPAPAWAWPPPTPESPGGRFDGKVVLRWAIAPTGAVKEISVTSSDFTPQPPQGRAEELGRCVSNLVGGWTFPKTHDGRALPVSYPFEFKFEGC